MSIQYSKEYLNDECYPLTLMTDIKVKGVKDSIYAVHRHINHKVKKLKVILINNLNKFWAELYRIIISICQIILTRGNR